MKGMIRQAAGSFAAEQEAGDRSGEDLARDLGIAGNQLIESGVVGGGSGLGGRSHTDAGPRSSADANHIVSGKLGEDVADGFGAEDGGDMSVLGACWDVEHVAGPGFDGVGVEAVLDTAFENKDAVAGLAPVIFWGAGGVGRAFLIAEGDTEGGDGLSDAEAGGMLGNGVGGGGEEVGALHGSRVALGA